MARGLVGLTAQQPCHRSALRIIHGPIDLLIIPMVHLGTGFLGGPLQGAEGWKLIARFHQRFDPHIENIRDDVFTLSGLKQGPDKDPPPAVAEGGNTAVGTDLRDVPLAEAPLLIVLEGLMWQQPPQHRGQMMNEPWGQDVKMGKVPEALKRFEEDYPAKRCHGGLRGTVNER